MPDEVTTIAASTSDVPGVADLSVVAPRVSPDRSSRWRAAVLPALVFLVATIAFMPRATIGAAVAAPMDLNTFGSPYRDRPVPVEVKNGIQTDVNEAQPWWLSFWRDARHGEWQTWSPNTASGTPTGTLPLNGSLSPFSWSALVLPGWAAINVRVGLLLFVAQLGAYLLARRLGLGRWASIAFGVAYAFSGTNLVFLLRIGAAALAPLLLWATHRLVSRPSVERFAVVAGIVAWVWTEGFPAALVFDLALAAGLVATMLAAELSSGRGRPLDRLKRVAWRGGLVGTAVVVGMLLSAVTLLPFVSELSSRGTLELEDRQYTSADHLAPESIFGLVDLSATGNPYTGPFFTIVNSFEGISLVGSIVLVAASLTMLQAARGRLVVSRRVARIWPWLVVGLVLVVVLTFVGTGLLTLAYQIPGFAGNRFHRARYIIGLLAGLIAAVGLDSVVRPDVELAQRTTLSQANRWAAGLSLVALSSAFMISLDDFSDIVDAANQGRNVMRGFVWSFVLLVGASALVVVARRVPTWKTPALFGLVLIIWVQLAWPMREYIPEVDRELFPHRTAGHRELSAATDGDRYRFAGSGLTTFYPGGAMLTGGFDLRGLTLQDPDFRRLLIQAAPQAFARDPFKAILVAPEVDFAAPALDHLSLRGFVISTNEEPIGTFSPDPGPPTSWNPIEDGLIGTFPAPGPIGGVAVALRGTGACREGMIELVATVNGRVVDRSSRPLVDVVGGWMWFALTGATARAGDSVKLAVDVSTRSCRLELGETQSTRIRWAELGDDGPIRLVATGQGWFYERASAWPLVSMHTKWSVVRSRDAAAAAVTAWEPGDAVPVVGGRSGNAGGTTRVHSFRLAGGSVRADVESTNGALMVVSMNDSTGWVASVSGRSTPVQSADGALLAVEVPPGRHRVTMAYRPSSFLIGRWISGVTLIVLVAAVVVGAVSGRRRVAP